jgi:hypothetical protein
VDLGGCEEPMYLWLHYLGRAFQRLVRAVVGATTFTLYSRIGLGVT